MIVAWLKHRNRIIIGESQSQLERDLGKFATLAQFADSTHHSHEVACEGCHAQALIIDWLVAEVKRLSTPTPRQAHEYGDD